MFMDFDMRLDADELYRWENPYDENFFLHYISCEEVFNLWDRYRHMQSDSMLVELMAHRHEHPETFGLVILFDKSRVFYFSIIVDRDAESIEIQDFITECYYTCSRCNIHDMILKSDIVACRFCRKSYCSDECFNNDRDQHVRCYERIKQLLCRVCAKKSRFKCSACKAVRYCSVDCQRLDYSKHKLQCKR